MTLKKSLIILIALGLLSSCRHKVNQDTIHKLGDYKAVKEVLFDNFENIKIAVDYQYFDSVRQVNYSTIINSNKYYFENTVARDNQDLKQLLKIWDEKLVYNHNVFGTISLNRDSVLIFTTDYNDGTFSGIGHYLIYNPTNNNSIFEKNGHRILELHNLGENWFYLIQRRNYVD